MPTLGGSELMHDMGAPAPARHLLMSVRTAAHAPAPGPTKAKEAMPTLGGSALMHDMGAPAPAH